jgi:hypothetical protein
MTECKHPRNLCKLNHLCENVPLALPPDRQASDLVGA